MSIFVGNLPFRAEQEDVEELFAPFGEVLNCSLPLERDTGRKRGFAFVEMAEQESEARAIEALQGVEMMGRPLRINRAEPRGGGGPRRSGGAGGYGISAGAAGQGGRSSGAQGWEDRSYGNSDRDPGDRFSDGFEAGRTRRRRTTSSSSDQ